MELKRNFGIATLAITAIILAFCMLPTKAGAISPSTWQAGRIIDDAIFFNSQTYDADQVQAFLNSQLGSCDTNGTQGFSGYPNRAAYGTSQGNPPPYVCLKDYVTSFSTIPGDEYCPGGLVGGTKSAAQIIAETAINCGINPQVILVTLQKEQSLIKDDWPWPIQYTKAMGYSCPDTAPCDPEFAGFAKQVYYGARQLQRYAQRPDLFPNYRPGRTNRIYYNPNASCGYSDVFVQTQATSNLYIYTPYQPNQASLNSLNTPPYTGDGCSSYGNRNFWRQFNDWFGPTIGPLVRSVTSPTLYYTDGSKKYSVSSFGLAEQYGLNLNDVRYLSQSEIDAIPTATYPLSQLVKSDSDSDEDGGALYLVSKGKRVQINDMQQFSDFGFQTSQISYMPIGNIYRMYADPDYLSYFVQSPSLFVYKVEVNKKRGIFDLSTYQSINPSSKISQLSDYTLGTIELGQPYIVGDAIMIGGDGKVWLFQDGSWYYVPSMDVYSCWGFNGIKKFSFSSSQAIVSPNPPALNCKAQKTNGDKFLMNRVNRISVEPEWNLNGFVSPLDRTIDRLSSVNLDAMSVFRSSSSNTLFILENGTKHALPDMETFYNLGYSNQDIITVDPGLLNSITSSVTKFASGALIKDSSGKVYVINESGKLYVPDISTYNSFGYVNPLITSSQVLAYYPTNGNLYMRSIKNGQAVMVESGTLWNIPDSIKAHFGIGGLTPIYNSLLTSSLNAQKTATRFVKTAQSSIVYYLDNGQKRPISSWQTLVDLGGTGNISVLGNWAISQFPTGSAI